MDGFSAHERISLKRSMGYSAAVIVAVGLIFYYLAALQFGFVADSTLFWGIIISLIVTSFISSVMEAAFSTITDDTNQFATGVTDEMEALYIRRSKLDAVLPVVPSKQQSRKVQRVHRESRRLKYKHRLASGVDRAVIVGSFASLSVFLNTSIAIFLPLSMHQSAQKLLLMPVPLFISSPICSATGKLCGVQAFDFTNQKLFLMATSTIPLLILGKIIPKSVGLNYPAFWLQLFWRLAPPVMLVFGWISVGCVWFFSVRWRKSTSR